MKVSKREQILIAVCVLVVAVIGLPTLQQLRPTVARGSVAELSRQAERSRQESAALRGEIERLEKEVASLTWSESPESLPPLLLKTLHGTAREAGVSLGSFRPGRLQAAASGSKLPVTVQVKASFPKAARFLERLQADQKRIALERVQIAATDAATDVVAMEIRLAVYCAAPAEPAKKPAAAAKPKG